jgi:D-sedoheptulose 7-phosphate isomerase
MEKQIKDCFDRGGTVWVCGNGGSSAEASHLSEEFISLGYPVIALNDPQVITALSNDFGFENAFTKYLWAVANPYKDLLVTLSTSYKSKNILNVIGSCDFTAMQYVKLPNKGKTTEDIQNNHLKIIHKLYLKFK